MTRKKSEVLQLHVFSTGKVRADSWIALWPKILALELKKFRTIKERMILDDKPREHSYIEYSGSTKADMLKLESVYKTLLERFMITETDSSRELTDKGVKIQFKWAKPTKKLEMVDKLERPKKGA